MTYTYEASRPSEHQDFSDEHAKQVWRFVHLLIECPGAVPTEGVLVFEQPTEGLQRATHGEEQAV